MIYMPSYGKLKLLGGACCYVMCAVWLV